MKFGQVPACRSWTAAVWRLRAAFLLAALLLQFGVFAAVVDQGDRYSLSGSNYTLSISKSNGSIVSFRGVATNDIFAGGEAGLWTVVYSGTTNGGVVQASSFSAASNTFSSAVSGDGLILSYSNSTVNVAVTLTNRTNGLDISAVVTPGGGITATELVLPAKLRFVPSAVQRFIAPSHSSDGVGAAYNSNFFQAQPETNAATWKSVAQADGGLGYRTIYGSGLLFSDDAPVSLAFTTNGQTWLGTNVTAAWNNSTARVNRPPAADQSDLTLIDSPNGPYFSGSHLGGGNSAGYLLRIGGNVNGATAIDRSLDIVSSAVGHLAGNPGQRTKVGVLSMERGPVIGETWPSEVRTDQWVSGLASKLPPGIAVVEIADMAELNAAAGSADYLAILNPYGELVPASLSGGVAGTVATIRSYVHAGGNWIEVGGHPFFFALQPQLYYSVELPYPAAFADFYQLDTSNGNASLFGVQNVLTDPANPWSTNSIFVPGNLSWGADASGGYCQRSFACYVLPGSRWQSPAVRLVAGYDASAALAQYANANGITRGLGTKMPASLLDKFKKSVLVLSHGTANQLSASMTSMPSPAILHFARYLKGGFDKEYPDHLPPNAANFGTPDEFMSVIAAAQSAGILTMPYSNPTLWSDNPRGPTFLAAGEAPLARRTDGSLVSETYFGQPGYAATPWHPGTQAANRRTIGLFTAASPLNYPSDTHYPADFFFQDQVGARSWLYDMNASSPSPTAYAHGLAAIAAEDSSKLPVSTENGFDRLINFNSQFCGLAWGLVPTPGAPVWRRFLDARYDPATWTIFPLAQYLAHDKLAFTYNDLGAPVANDEVVAWTLGLGYGMTYILNDGDLSVPATREWLRWIDRLQKSVAARYIGGAVSTFTHTRGSGSSDGSIDATYGPVAIASNLDATNRAAGGRTLAPRGFVATAPGLVAARMIEPGGSLPVSYVAETKISGGADFWIYSVGARTVTIELPSGFNGSVLSQIDGAAPATKVVSGNLLTVSLPSGADPAQSYLWHGTLSSPVKGRSVLFDLGSSYLTTNPAVSLNGTTNFWNNITLSNTTNLVFSDNTVSGWNFRFATSYSFNPTNAFAPLPRADLGVFALPTVTQDGAFYFTTNTALSNGITAQVGSLNRSNRYTVRLYGARDATVTRTTVYTVTGTNSQTNSLQTSGTGIDTNSAGSVCNYNASRFLTFYDVAPDTNSQITINFRSTNDLAYLNALSVEEFEKVAPVVSLRGNSTLYWTKGVPFADPGATVADNVDGASTVNGTGTVDTSTAGSYTLTYYATDSAGNTAVPVTRTVIVSNPKYLVDFGRAGMTNWYSGANPPSPDANGNSWNSVDNAAYWLLTNSAGSTNGAPYFGFIAATNAFFTAYNGPAGAITNNPPTTNDLAAVTINSNALGMLGVREAAFDYVGGRNIRFVFNALSASKKYKLTFFGSRKYEGDAATAVSVFNASNTVVATNGDTVFNPANLIGSGVLTNRATNNASLHNQDAVLSLDKLVPSAGGSLYLSFAGASGGVGVINSMSIEEAQVLAPVITSTNGASGTVGVPFSYQITADNNPTSYGATGLPSGLTVNTNTGLVAGTPTVAANTAVLVSASNEAGTGTAGVNFNIVAASVPVVTSPTSITYMYGKPFSYQISAAGGPTSFSASGLPEGLSLNPSTGLITGTISAPTNTVVQISAVNSAGTNTVNLVIDATGQELLVDFGQTPTTNASTGKAWNNWTNGGQYIANLVDSSGAASGYSLYFTTGVSWTTNFGVQPLPSLGVFAETNAVSDGVYTTDATNGSTLAIAGLNPDNLYAFYLFGSRDATSTRVASYTLAGSNSVTAVLTNSGTDIGGTGVNYNTNILALTGIRPDRNGKVTLNYKAASGGFGYLNALRVTTTNFPLSASTYLAQANRWMDQDAISPEPTNALLFLGSSSIRRWESVTRDFADYRMIQRGMGGATFADINQLAASVALRYAPRAIVMWAGVNDLYADRSAAHVFQQFTNFVGTVTNNLPSTKLFYIGITRNPVFAGNSAQNTERTNANTMISGFIATNGSPNIVYVDLPSFFESLTYTTNMTTANPAELWYYQVDYGHLNQRGYDVWKTSVRQALLAAGVFPDRPVAVPPLAPVGGDRILFDFGPADGTNGDAATGIDANGNQWNNWHQVNGSATIVAGEHKSSIIDCTGAATGVEFRITGDFVATGKTNGGLLTVPSLALGNLGTASATQDYFYTTADAVAGGGDDNVPGGFMVSGLNPNLAYDLRFFGSRDASSARQTAYRVYGATSNAPAILQTSGAGSGINGGTGNSRAVALVSSVKPNAFGDIFIDVSSLEQTNTADVYGYINAMEIVALSPYEAWTRSKGIAGGTGNGLGATNPFNGFSNLRNFAFDGEPGATTNEASKLAARFSQGTNKFLSLTMPVRYGASFSVGSNYSASIDGLTYRVLGSTNLVDWSTPVEEVYSAGADGLPALSVSGPGGYQYRSFRLSDPSLAKGFIRAVAETAPGSKDAASGAASGLQAEKYTAMQGVQTEPGGGAIGYFDSGDWIKYGNVDFGSGATSATLSASKSGSGGSVEIRLGSPTGRLIGTFTPQDTGGWGNYREQVVQLSGFVSGVQDVYLVGTGAAGICNLDWFRFSRYVLAWSDEFSGSTLNTNNWSAVWNGDVGNGELQFYTPRTNNVLVADGVLKLTALRESYTGQGPWMSAPKTTDYTSGLVESLGKVQPQYGKIEASMKIPRGAGLWPAFWMMGTNYFTPGVGWPKCGEIDIMEYSGASGGFTAAFHTGAYNYLNGGGGVLNTQGFSLGDYDTAFHLYGIEWTPTRVAFYVDGKVVLTADKAQMGTTADQWPFDQPFWLKLNLAVGGSYGGDPITGAFPKTMEIDWVRVYQQQSD